MIDIRIRFDSTLRIIRYFNLKPQRLFFNHCRFCSSTPNVTSTDTTSRLENLCFDLERRKLLHDTFPPALATERFRQLRSIADVIYAGFDPSADSLHIGNLLVLLVLLRASIFGCQSIAIVGGATALVGDPSGRDNDRHEISTDIARNNVDAIQRQINDIYTNFQQNRSSSIPLIVINNNEWYSKMLMLDFLQISRSFRVGEMLRKRTMRTRPGISFTEFAYQILQSYDWLQLYRMHNCRMQIGGADQLGNFDAGYDLIKANCDDTHVFAVTLELMNDAIGHKMSKSSGNAIWLNAQRTSSYAFYQYFRQKSDAEIPLALRWFSLKSCDEIEMLIDKHERDPGRWLAQISLAEEMTELVHGCDGLESARRCARILFDASSDMNAFCDVQADEIESAIGIASTFYLSINEIRTMGQLADAVPPPNTSQRGSSLMKRGGLKINGQKLVDPDQQILLESICMPNSRLTIVCWGKRKYYLVKWID